ncbi:MAG TPA: hypothetical protein VFY96_14695 [Candidatus Binatia bacterium]|nr:hypothetical protein [Candidatus Binatia bacterium]
MARRFTARPRRKRLLLFLNLLLQTSLHFGGLDSQCLVAHYRLHIGKIDIDAELVKHRLHFLPRFFKLLARNLFEVLSAYALK